MTQHQAEAAKKFTAVPGRHTGPVSKILIANRGEIAVRVIRAARDEGLQTVAVYADPDRDAQHVKLADEAYALGGATAAQSYLVMDKLIEIAIRSGADAVHPGYGFLSENAQFAQKCIDAGLTWIGPSPESITQLGDKVAARHIAQKVGAPLVPGTKDPVKSADEVVAFADEHGLPIAVKAAFGGGGRGIKVARDRESIVEMYESAVREATAAFGRGECFIERFLDSPRHVETQCLADAHGNVVVVSTRDCSLQRRNQKLIEEAPAPYLSDEQNERLYEASRAILREAGYQVPAPVSSWSAPTAPFPSLRSTLVCRWSTPSPRRFRVLTWYVSSSVLPAARRLRRRTRFCVVTPSSSVLTVRMRAVPSCPPPAPSRS